jgi:preprotein translocase subunit SecY
LQDLYQYIQQDPEIMQMYAESVTPEATRNDIFNNPVVWFTLCGVIYFILSFIFADKYILQKAAAKTQARKFKKNGWMYFAII